MVDGTLKCVVIGDGSVGKTCLLIRYAKDEYPTAYIPTVFDSYAVKLPVGDEIYELNLFDTAGQEEYDQLRKLAFTNTDVLLVCFAVDFWPSFVNVRDLWIPEIQKYCPGVPFVIIGTKTDLRNDPMTTEKLAAQGKSPVSKEQGDKLAKELRAVKYLECSALTKENVNNVFQEAIVIAFNISQPHESPTDADDSSATNDKNKSENNKNNNANTTRNDNDGCNCCTVM